MRICHGVEAGRPPLVDLAAEKRLADFVSTSIARGLVRAAHDISVGGAAIALAESTFAQGVGAAVDLGGSAASLFSEAQGRILVAIPPGRLDEFLAAAGSAGVPAGEIGETGGDRLVLAFDGGAVETQVSELHDLWSKALPLALEG